MLDIYTISKLSKFSKQNNWNPNIIIAIWGISALSFILWIYLIINRFNDPLIDNTTSLIFQFVSIWYLPKILISIILLPFDFVNFLKRTIYSHIKKDKVVSIHKSNESIKGRRLFVQNTALGFAGIPFLLAFKGIILDIDNLQIFRENIQLHKLPQSLDGLRIIQISDIHFGSFPDKRTIKEMCYQINGLNADIIFITGDFVNFSQKELILGIEELGQLKSRYGIYACLGNHDHYMNADEHEQLIKIIKNNNIQLLINENITLNINESKLNIVGVDYSGHRLNYADWGKSFDGISPLNTTILLCHDPKSWDQSIIGKTCADLTLAGHTHGGQVAFELFGQILSPAQFTYKQYAGLYRNRDQYLYVNRGIGTSGPPIRLFMNPEITLITLKTSENLAVSNQ